VLEECSGPIVEPGNNGSVGTPAPDPKLKRLTTQNPANVETQAAESQAISFKGQSTLVELKGVLEVWLEITRLAPEAFPDLALAHLHPFHVDPLDVQSEWLVELRPRTKLKGHVELLQEPDEEAGLPQRRVPDRLGPPVSKKKITNPQPLAKIDLMSVLQRERERVVCAKLHT